MPPRNGTEAVPYEHKERIMKDNDFVIIVDVYSRNPNGGIDHWRLLPTACDGCAATHDSPSECPCDRCVEGRHE